MFFYYHFCSGISGVHLEYEHNNQVVTGCSTDSRGEVFIPQQVTEIKIGKPDNYAFKKCKDSITSLRFDKNSQIAKIGEYSFKNTALEKADLGECKVLKIINAHVFENCKNLKTVILPPNLERIGISCFSYDPNLTSLDLPDSVYLISGLAFYFSGLTIINISSNSSLQKLNQECFKSTNLTSIFIPKNVTDIGSSVFLCCQNLENITVDQENANFTSDTKSLYTRTDNSTLIKVVEAYSGAYTVASYVTTISEECFSYCTKILSIQIDDKVKEIGKDAFSYCDSLTSIKMPGNIEIIQSGTFQNCSSLRSIKIPDSTKIIGAYAFKFCKSLISIIIPQNVNDVLDYAFSSCSNLINITFLGIINEIKSYTFQYCISLTNITFSDRITTIQNYAFYSCQSLTSITIPDSVNTIGVGVFKSCKSLSSITIPLKIAKINNEVFYECTSLISITILGYVSYIGDKAFGNCESLTSITFQNNITSIRISSTAFSDIPNRMNIYIKGRFNVYQGPKNAFRKRSNLYITSETILRKSCKDFFGEESVYVHFEGSTQITDTETIDVIKYISYPLPTQDFPFVHENSVHFTSDKSDKFTWQK